MMAVVDASRSAIKMRLREARHNAGMTQDQLAEKMDRYQQQVWRWESHGFSTPDPEVLVAIAKHTGVDPAWLILGVGDDVR